MSLGSWLEGMSRQSITDSSCMFVHAIDPRATDSSGYGVGPLDIRGYPNL